MAISAKLVKELRDKTGAGMMDCKKALTEVDGDLEKAVDFLRKKGLADASKKAGRIASEGAVGSYIHMGGRVGVLIEVNCETDFVGKTDKFQNLVRDLAMQVAASKPEFVRPEEVSTDQLDRERAIYREQGLAEGKPEKIIEKIVEGRIQKYFNQVCLMNQPFIKDDKKTVTDYVNECISEIGENIQVRRFVRYELGEGLEKRQDDLAAEVAKAVAGE
jgi:elongation factor Ts